MRILISNDDGINAPGIGHLVDELSKKHLVYIVAPEGEKSGAAMSLTIRKPIAVTKVDFDGAIEAYAIKGTPVDCVKIAVKKLIKPAPELIISGINPGSNIGINLMYSGTVGCVLEGLFQGISGVAISMPSSGGPGYEYCASVSSEIVEKVFSQNIPNRLGLNVNFPLCSASEIKGIRLTRQCSGGIFEDYREIEGEKNSFKLEGNVYCESTECGLDTAAVSRGWISVTPIRPFLNDSEGKMIIDGVNLRNFRIG